MKRLALPGSVLNSFKAGKQTLFWLNGQIINVVGNKRHSHKFATQTGFLANKVADYELALKTIKKVCRESGLDFGNFFNKNKAILFVATDSSPLEKTILSNLFKEVGFNEVELRPYETAFGAFLVKQNYDKGSFVYVGKETSEIGVFADNAQRSFVVYYSLADAVTETIYFFRERHALELAENVALNLYQELGAQGEKFSLVVRGRSSRNKELQTVSLLFKDVEPLYSFLQKQVIKEIESVRQDNVFKQINPDRWMVLGDEFFKRCLDLLGEKTLQLKSEFDLMQGVEWL